MAFLCPVRIRNNGGSSTRKKKQSGGGGGDGGKKRSFLNSSVINSLINSGSHEDNREVDNNNVIAPSPNQQQQQQNSSGVVQGPGRITGSSSIETLVRVGLEKEAGIPPEARNMVVLHDFTPCVDDELEVRQGSVVSILYRENDWVYVILEGQGGGDSREGFIPHSYCAPYGSPLAEMALCNSGGGGGNGKRGGRRLAASASVSDSEANHHRNQQTQQRFHPRPHSSFDDDSASVATAPFYKDPSPTRFIALYKFTARDENDVNVERGEILTVLNKDDPDWFYVVRSDGCEGFVPSAFVYPLSSPAPQHQPLPHHQPQTISLPTSSTGSQQNQQPTYQSIDNDYADAQHHPHPQQSPIGGQHPLIGNFTPSPPAQSPQQQQPPAQNNGTELVMLYDYKAQAPDDLSVRRGDWVYADLLHQTVEGWLWAYAPKQRKYGFIPKAYARPPAMTSL